MWKKIANKETKEIEKDLVAGFRPDTAIAKMYEILSDYEPHTIAELARRCHTTERNVGNAMVWALRNRGKESGEFHVISDIGNGKRTLQLLKGGQWSVAEAKARFSLVIERTRSGGPQVITRHGRMAAVVVGPEEWKRKTARHGSLAQFFASSPLRGAGMKINRAQGRVRNPGL